MREEAPCRLFAVFLPLAAKYEVFSLKTPNSVKLLIFIKCIYTWREKSSDKKNKLFSSVHFSTFPPLRDGLGHFWIFISFSIYSFASLYLCRQDKMFTPFDVDFQFHSFTFPHQIVNTFQGLLFKSEAF